MTRYPQLYLSCELTIRSNCNSGMAIGGVQFQDPSARALQMLPSKSTTHRHPTLLPDRIRVACLNVGGFKLQCCNKLT